MVPFAASVVAAIIKGGVKTVVPSVIFFVNWFVCESGSFHVSVASGNSMHQSILTENFISNKQIIYMYNSLITLSNVLYM